MAGGLLAMGSEGGPAAGEVVHVSGWEGGEGRWGAGSGWRGGWPGVNLRQGGWTLRQWRLPARAVQPADRRHGGRLVRPTVVGSV